MLPTAARGHAFLYKYRPRAPGGLRLQQPGRGKPNRCGCRLGKPRAGGTAKGSADTWWPPPPARGGRGRGGRGCHAARAAAGVEAGRQAGGRSPPGRRTGTDGRQSTAAAARGRPEARKSDFPAGSPRRIRLFLSFSFSFFF